MDRLWRGAELGDQRATGTQAGGESQALRQWGEKGGRRELRGTQWGGVAMGVACNAWKAAQEPGSRSQKKTMQSTHITGANLEQADRENPWLCSRQ